MQASVNEPVRRRRVLAIAAGLAVLGLQAAAQQLPDREFLPSVDSPAYAAGRGPVICLDEAHANFHTLDDRFWAFGELLRRDGYVLRPNTAKFDLASLAQCAVLVISNARPTGVNSNPYPYPAPSAFTEDEVAAVHRWVRDGGRLLLIADHMPAAGAAASLAAAFGVSFTNGFAVEAFGEESERDAAFDKPTIFRTADGSLRSHAIVQGRSAKEAITAIRTFTGQAFQAPLDAEPLLVLPDNFIALMPEIAWQFGPATRRIPVGGWLQGAVLSVERGRAAFFGEAAMFTAQVTGPERGPMGMNAPGAEQNAQFTLNVLHWLSGVL